MSSFSVQLPYGFFNLLNLYSYIAACDLNLSLKSIECEYDEQNLTIQRSYNWKKHDLNRSTNTCCHSMLNEYFVLSLLFS